VIRRVLPLVLLGLVATASAVAGWGVGGKLGKPPAPAAARAAQDGALVQHAIASLAPQRPGHPDLYVLGFAGDGSEPVFRNEVLFLRDLASQRMDAAGRVLVLSNQPDEPPRSPVPRASVENLQAALAGIGATLDPAEDLLLLYLTTHGTEDHELLLRRPGAEDAFMDAAQVRYALDAAGIRHRVIAISACYSGGLVDELRGRDTLLLTAARSDRTSFGCGNDSVATFFGRAWLVDGLNATLDFHEAFEMASAAITAREAAEELTPSLPQATSGDRIDRRLAAWRAGFTPGPALAYPHAEPEDIDYSSAEGGGDPDVVKELDAAPAAGMDAVLVDRLIDYRQPRRGDAAHGQANSREKRW